MTLYAYPPIQTGVLVVGDPLEEPAVDIYDTLLTNLADGAAVALSDYPDTPVFISHDGVPEMARDYVAQYVLGITRVGAPYVSTLATSTEKLHIQSHYEIRTQYTFVGKSSFSLASSFYQRVIYNPIVSEALARNKISVYRTGDVLAAPQRRETKWVNAYTLDVHFGFAIETQQTVDIVESVVFTDPFTNEKYTITIA